MPLIPRSYVADCIPRGSDPTVPTRGVDGRLEALRSRCKELLGERDFEARMGPFHPILFAQCSASRGMRVAWAPQLLFQAYRSLVREASDTCTCLAMLQPCLCLHLCCLRPLLTARLLLPEWGAARPEPARGKGDQDGAPADCHPEGTGFRSRSHALLAPFRHLRASYVLPRKRASDDRREPHFKDVCSCVSHGLNPHRSSLLSSVLYMLSAQDRVPLCFQVDQLVRRSPSRLL